MSEANIFLSLFLDSEKCIPTFRGQAPTREDAAKVIAVAKESAECSGRGIRDIAT